MANGAEDWNTVDIPILADLFQVKTTPGIRSKSLIFCALRLRLMRIRQGPKNEQAGRLPCLPDRNFDQNRLFSSTEKTARAAQPEEADAKQGKSRATIRHPCTRVD